ncbi:MAG: glucose 1-dehydrogenase [Chlorobi bacterium]|nr:glucose 1-dehydrogenase [Chlorobiota bacterium]
MNKYLEMFNIQNRVAVVTGASEGIGHDIAIGLAEAGTDLIICSRNKQKLEAVKTEIENLDRKVATFVLDVCKVSEIEKLKAFILKRFGKVDILVNNAGYAVTKMAQETTEDDWDKMLDTGLKGVFFCSQIIGSIMSEKKYGKIINIGSTFSHSTIPGRSVYAALKAGLCHLSESLAVEWAQNGIRVNVIAPSAVKTPSREDLLQGDILKMVLGRIPLGRLATPDDLICAIIYLASPASDFVTGQTLFVDGGWVAKG